MTHNHFDFGRKSFRTGTCDNYIYLPLNDETVTAFQSDIGNADYVTMWRQLCNNMWNKNIRSPLRQLLNLNDKVDVTIEPLLERQRLLDATSIKILSVDGSNGSRKYGCIAYSDNVFRLLLDNMNEHDRHDRYDRYEEDYLIKSLKRILFISGDQNPSSGCPPDEARHSGDELEQIEYILQFDSIKVKLNLQCQLAPYIKSDDDDDPYLPDEKDYVYDSRVCRIKACFSSVSSD